MLHVCIHELHQRKSNCIHHICFEKKSINYNSICITHLPTILHHCLCSDFVCLRVLPLLVGWLWPAPLVQALTLVWFRAAPVARPPAALRNADWTITTVTPPVWLVEQLPAHGSPSKPQPAAASPSTKWTWKESLCGLITSLTRWEQKAANTMLEVPWNA